MDIDRRTRLFGKLKFVGFCAYGLANGYVFLKVSSILGLMMLPLFAWFASRYLVHGLFDSVPHWGKRLIYRRWNGKYYEFDGRQIRVEDFGGDVSQIPLIAVDDLENLIKDRARFRIKDTLLPSSGLLQDIAAVRADKACTWAQMIARSANAEADRAQTLALFIERSFVAPKLKHDHLNTVAAPNPELWGLKPRNTPDAGTKEEQPPPKPQGDS